MNSYQKSVFKGEHGKNQDYYLGIEREDFYGFTNNPFLWFSVLPNQDDDLLSKIACVINVW